MKNQRQGLQAAPHKARLTAWRHICLHLFRHLAQKFLAGREPSGVISIQSDEKSGYASAPPALCGVAFKQSVILIVSQIGTLCNRQEEKQTEIVYLTKKQAGFLPPDAEERCAAAFFEKQGGGLQREQGMFMDKL